MKTKTISRLSNIFLLLVLMINHATAQHTTAKASVAKQSGYAPVNGLKIYYEVHGSGRPLVLLHGAYMTIGLNWSQIIPELAKTHQVIVMEMQGHGHTADSDRPFSYPALASDVAGVLKYLKTDSADVLGYSVGGAVATQLAIDHPKLVKRLIVVSSAYKQEGWLPEVREMLKSFNPGFFDNTPLPAEYKRVAPDTAHWYKFAAKMIAFDASPYNLGEEKVKAIKAATLLISGDNDGVDLNHLAAWYRLLGGGVFGDVAGLPKSQLAILPGKTHVTLMMQPESVIAAVERFLSSKQQESQPHH